MKKIFTLFAVAVLAFTAQAATLTVSDGTQSNAHYPFYGLYYDTEGTTSQVIYPATELTDMVGKQITEITYYSRDNFYLTGGNLQFSIKVVEETEFATSALYTMAEEDVYVATCIPPYGENVLVLTLDKPFVYEGGNLLIEGLVTVGGGYSSTYFYGQDTGLYGACYSYVGWSGTPYTAREAFMPKTTFTYEDGQVTPPEPTVQTGAPTFNGYTTDGIHAYFLEIIETEPSTIYYRVQYPDGTWTEWAEYEEVLSFVGDGKYRVEAYAVADGKLPSEQIAYEFVVSPLTGLSELANGKTVAGVRYYNVAGQEMQEANGLTIVVTTYTDGTTSTAKVIK